jgi:hypothetical protein
MMVPDNTIGRATTEGFPWDMPEIICNPKLLVKKSDCSCKTPSMSQMVASTNCSVLLPSGLFHA